MCSKHKKKQLKKSYNRNEPFDSALNLAGGLAMAKERRADDGCADSVIYMPPGAGDHCDHISDDKKYRWRKYCVDGSAYGVYPEDYETADDYADALEAAMEDR